MGRGHSWISFGFSSLRAYDCFTWSVTSKTYLKILVVSYNRFEWFLHLIFPSLFPNMTAQQAVLFLWLLLLLLSRCVRVWACCCVLWSLCADGEERRGGQRGCGVVFVVCVCVGLFHIFCGRDPLQKITTNARVWLCGCCYCYIYNTIE